MLNFSHRDGILLSVLLIVAIVTLVAVWLYALISALKNERLDSTMKLVWVLVIILVVGLGPVIYLIVAPNRLSRIERGMAELHFRKRQLAKQAKDAGTTPPSDWKI